MVPKPPKFRCQQKTLTAEQTAEQIPRNTEEIQLKHRGTEATERFARFKCVIRYGYRSLFLGGNAFKARFAAKRGRKLRPPRIMAM